MPDSSLRKAVLKALSPVLKPVVADDNPDLTSAQLLKKVRAETIRIYASLLSNKDKIDIKKGSTGAISEVLRAYRESNLDLLNRISKPAFDRQLHEFDQGNATKNSTVDATDVEETRLDEDASLSSGSDDEDDSSLEPQPIIREVNEEEDWWRHTQAADAQKRCMKVCLKDTSGNRILGLGPLEIRDKAFTIGQLKDYVQLKERSNKREPRRLRWFMLNERVLEDDVRLQNLLEVPFWISLDLTVVYDGISLFDDEVDQVSAGRYVVQEQLWKTSSTGDREVFKGMRWDADQLQKVVIKKYRHLNPEHGVDGCPLREAGFLQDFATMNHDNIVKLVEVMCSSKNLYIVTESMEMDLMSYLKSRGAITDQVQLRQLTRHCYRGLSACHLHGIMHRNLKSANVLINSATMHAKLVDFRFARKISFDPTRTYTILGASHQHVAPELLLGSANYSLPVDIWGMGCVVVEAAKGGNLFVAPDSNYSMMLQHFQLLGTPTEEVWPGVTKLPNYSKCGPQWRIKGCQDYYYRKYPALGEDGADLLARCVKLCPDHRLTAKQALMHPFLATSEAQDP